MAEELHRVVPSAGDGRTPEHRTDETGIAGGGVLRYLELLKALAAVRRPSDGSATA